MSNRKGIEAGKAYIEASWDNTRVGRGLTKMKAMIKSAGQGMLRLGGYATTAGGVMLAALVKPLSAASRLEETMSKFNTVFGSMASGAKAWGDAFAKQIGRSGTEVAGFLAGTQDLLVPLGFESGAAEGMSKDVTKLAYDLASFNNLADADALNDLQAALTGSGEVMKKYGVVVNEAGVKQELLNNAIDPKTATEAQKAWARWNIILRGTTAAQGDAERTAGSWANMQKRLNAGLERLYETLGSKLIPVLSPYLAKLNDAVASAAEWVKQNEGLVIGFLKWGGVLLGLGGTLTGLGVTLNVLSGAITGLTAGAGLLAGVTLPTLAAAAAAVTAVSLAAWAIRSSSAMRELNAALAESARLQGKIDSRQDRKRQSILDAADQSTDPAKREAFLKEQLAAAEREAAGARASAKGARTRADELAGDRSAAPNRLVGDAIETRGVMRRFTGNQNLADAEREAELAAKNAERAEAFIAELKARLASAGSTASMPESAGQAGDAEAAETASERIADLERELAVLNGTMTETEAEIQRLGLNDLVDQSTVDQLRALATEIDRVKAAKEAAEKAATEIEQQRQDAEREAQSEADRIRELGESITEQFRTPAEVLRDEVEELQFLLDSGAINQTTFDRAMKDAKGNYKAATKGASDDTLTKAVLAGSQEAADLMAGIINGVGPEQEPVVDAIDNQTDTLVAAIKGGNLGGAAQGLQDELPTQIAAQLSPETEAARQRAMVAGQNATGRLAAQNDRVNEVTSRSASAMQSTLGKSDPSAMAKAIAALHADTNRNHREAMRNKLVVTPSDYRGGA